jgi:hypothetical protein
MFLLNEILRGILLPAGLATVLLAISGWWSRRPAVKRRRPAWTPAVALGVGYVVGHIAIRGRPPYPPSLSMDAGHWIAVMAPAAMLLGVIEAAVRLPSWLRWALRAALLMLLLWLMLNGMLSPDSDNRLSWFVLAAIGLAALRFWGDLEALAARVRGPSLPFGLMLIAAGASGVLVASGSLVQGLQGGTLTAILGVLFLASFWHRDRRLLRSGVPVVAVILIGLSMEGFFYSYVPPASIVLLAIAPGGIWLGRNLAARCRSRWVAGVLTTIAVLVPVGLALATAIATSPAQAHATVSPDEM